MTLKTQKLKRSCKFYCKDFINKITKQIILPISSELLRRSPQKTQKNETTKTTKANKLKENSKLKSQFNNNIQLTLDLRPLNTKKSNSRRNVMPVNGPQRNQLQRTWRKYNVQNKFNATNKLPISRMRLLNYSQLVCRADKLLFNNKRFEKNSYSQFCFGAHRLKSKLGVRKFKGKRSLNRHTKIKKIPRKHYSGKKKFKIGISENSKNLNLKYIENQNPVNIIYLDRRTAGLDANDNSANKKKKNCNRKVVMSYECNENERKHIRFKVTSDCKEDELDNVDVDYQLTDNVGSCDTCSVVIPKIKLTNSGEVNVSEDKKLVIEIRDNPKNDVKVKPNTLEKPKPKPQKLTTPLASNQNKPSPTVNIPIPSIQNKPSSKVTIPIPSNDKHYPHISTQTNNLEPKRNTSTNSLSDFCGCNIRSSDRCTVAKATPKIVVPLPSPNSKPVSITVATKEKQSAPSVSSNKSVNRPVVPTVSTRDVGISSEIHETGVGTNTETAVMPSPVAIEVIYNAATNKQSRENNPSEPDCSDKTARCPILVKHDPINSRTKNIVFVERNLEDFVPVANPLEFTQQNETIVYGYCADMPPCKVDAETNTNIESPQSSNSRSVIKKRSY